MIEFLFLWFFCVICSVGLLQTSERLRVRVQERDLLDAEPGVVGGGRRRLRQVEQRSEDPVLQLQLVQGRVLGQHQAAVEGAARVQRLRRRRRPLRLQRRVLRRQEQPFGRL